MKNLKLTLYDNYKLENLLILLLPLLAIFSIFFLELALVVVGGSFIFRILFNYEKKYLINKFLLIFCIFCIYLFLNYFFSEKNDNQNYLFIFFYFRYGLYVISIYYFLDKIVRLEINFYKSVIFAIIILLLDGYFQFFNGENIFGYKMIDNNRVASFFADR